MGRQLRSCSISAAIHGVVQPEGYFVSECTGTLYFPISTASQLTFRFFTLADLGCNSVR